MTPAVLGAFVAAGLVAIADWVAVARGDRTFEGIAKPAVIVCLLVAVGLADVGGSPARWLLLAALAASLAGDWLLLPPGRFVPGLVAFLVAHLAYLAIFLRGPLELGLAGVGAAGAFLLLLTAGRRILAGAGSSGLAAPVAAYFVAICAMAVAATASGSVLAAAGAWLFVASDTVLGWNRFVRVAGAPESATRRVAVIVPYHIGQVLLTLAILGLPA